MNPKGRQGGSWPTQQQELLLRAALTQGEEALRAWQEWKLQTDIQELDPGSYRLLPQLFRNLQAQEVEDPVLEILRGIYRLNWSKNQLLFHNSAQLLGSFHEQGIPTLLLKGSALVKLHYCDLGLRPMSDFDILVQTESARKAVDVAIEAGWVPQWGLSDDNLDRYIRVSKGVALRNSAGYQVDLHWHALHESNFENGDLEFWEGAVVTSINGISTLALNPSDTLLHVCVHGSKWDPIPPFRWISDSMAILNTSGDDLDWDRVVRLGKKLRSTVPLQHTLGYLQRLMNFPVPSSTLRSLGSGTRFERVEYGFLARPRHSKFYLIYLATLYLRFLRLKGPTSRKAMVDVVGFAKFLQFTWRLNSLLGVPGFAVKRLIKGPA